MASDIISRRIYTAGLGRKELGDIVAELKSAGVKTVVDIRTYNRSKRHPEYSSERLRQELKKEGIAYEWQGEVLGGNPKDRSFYVDGSRENPVDYSLQEASGPYQEAVDALSERVRAGEAVCVLGGESDPAYSHRALAFGQAFERRSGIGVSHIVGVGRTLTQGEVITRAIGGERMMAAVGLPPDGYLRLTFLSDGSTGVVGNSVIIMKAADADKARRMNADGWSYGTSVEIVESSEGSFKEVAHDNAVWGDVTLALSSSFSSPSMIAAKEASGGRFVTEQLPLHAEDLRDPEMAMASAARICATVKSLVSKGGYELFEVTKKNSFDRDVVAWTGGFSALGDHEFEQPWALLGLEIVSEGWGAPTLRLCSGSSDNPSVQVFSAGQEDAFSAALSEALESLPGMAGEEGMRGVMLFDENFSDRWRGRLGQAFPSFAEIVSEAIDPLKDEVSDVIMAEPLKLNVIGAPLVGSVVSSLDGGDLETYARNVLGYVIDGGVDVSAVRTSGQSGMETAFTCAAQFWMRDPSVLCPAGFRLTMDDGTGFGMNVADEAMFVNRFKGARRELVDNLPKYLETRYEEMIDERVRLVSPAVSEERSAAGLSDEQILTLRLCGLSNTSLSEVIRAARGRTFSGSGELKALLEECRENGVEGMQFIAEPMIENMTADARRYISEGEKAGVHLVTVESALFPASLSDIPAPSSFRGNERSEAEEAESELNSLYELYGFTSMEMAEIGEEWRRRSGRGQETGMNLDDGAPVLLWYRGNLSALDTLSVSLVGSTTPLPETELATRRFSQRTAQTGASVVVSWTPGTSLAAMETAVANNGQVVAVMAGGLDDRTVHMTAGLASRVVGAGGLLLSEWPVGVRPDTYKIELRERLVAALGDGMVVISGSTGGRSAGIARKAYEMNRTVFAVQYTDAVTNEIREKISGNIELVRQGAKILPSTAGQEYDEAIMMISGAGENDISEIRKKRAAEKVSTLVIAPDPKRAVRYSVLHLPHEEDVYLVAASDTTARNAVLEFAGGAVRFEEPRNASAIREDYIRRSSENLSMAAYGDYCAGKMQGLLNGALPQWDELPDSERAAWRGSRTGMQAPQPWTGYIYFRDGEMQDMMSVFSKGMPPQRVRVENKLYFDMLKESAVVIQAALQEAAGLPRTPAYRFAEAMYLSITPDRISVMQGDRVRGSVYLSPIGTIRVDYVGDGPVYRDGPGLERLGYYEQEKPVFRTRLAGMNVSTVRGLASDMANALLGFGDDEQRYIFASRAFADERHRSTQLDKNEEVEAMGNADNVTVAALDVAKAVSQGVIADKGCACASIDSVIRGLDVALNRTIHKLTSEEKSQPYITKDKHQLLKRCGSLNILQFSRSDSRMAYAQKGKYEAASRWYDRCYAPTEGVCRVRKNGRMNILSSDMSMEMLCFDKLHRPMKASPSRSTEMWPDYVGEFRDGVAMISHGGKYNFVNTEGRLLCRSWYDKAREYSEGFAAVCTFNSRNDGRGEELWNFIDGKGRELYVQEFSYVGDFRQGWAVVRSREDEEVPMKYNFVNTEKRYLTKRWYDRAEDFSEGFAVIEKDGLANFIGTDGKEFFRNWCSETRSFHEGWAVIRTREDETPSLKYNYVNRRNQLLSKEWLDNALDFDNGRGHAVCEGVEYDIDRPGWRRPLFVEHTAVVEEAEEMGQEQEQEM